MTEREFREFQLFYIKCVFIKRIGSRKGESIQSEEDKRRKSLLSLVVAKSERVASLQNLVNSFTKLWKNRGVNLHKRIMMMWWLKLQILF